MSCPRPITPRAPGVASISTSRFVAPPQVPACSYSVVGVQAFALYEGTVSEAATSAARAAGERWNQLVTSLGPAAKTARVSPRGPRAASSLPACTRSRTRGVLVFGGVGPPRRCVCHDRGPGRICGPCVSRGAQAGGVRPLPPPATRRCRGGPCTLTRCRVVRGGGVMRCAGRRDRPRGAAGGLAPPAPAAPDRRPAGPRRRAVPARE